MNPIPRVVRRVLSLAVRRAGEWRARRSGRRSAPLRTSSPSSGSMPEVSSQQPRTVHADEATIRHTAEEQLGGTSSQESREAYLRGDRPGGLHQGGPGAAAVKRGDEEE